MKKIIILFFFFFACGLYTQAQPQSCDEQRDSLLQLNYMKKEIIQGMISAGHELIEKTSLDSPLYAFYQSEFTKFAETYEWLEYKSFLIYRGGCEVFETPLIYNVPPDEESDWGNENLNGHFWMFATPTYEGFQEWKILKLLDDIETQMGYKKG